MKCYLDGPKFHAAVVLRFSGRGKVIAKVAGVRESGLPHFDKVPAMTLTFEGSFARFVRKGNQVSATVRGSSGDLTVQWKLNKAGTEWTPKVLYRVHLDENEILSMFGGE